MRRCLAGAAALLAATQSAQATETAAPPVEPPSLAVDVAAGRLPPLAERLPTVPRIVDPRKTGGTLGRYGGRMRWLMGKPKDRKMIFYYGYARLVVYDRQFEIVPDLLQDIQVEGSRIFTLKLRPGHKWSNGQPFTAEDFRYTWEDVYNDPKMKWPVPRGLLVRGKPPVFEVIDQYTVRYTWHAPNPEFLSSLAATLPVRIFLPSQYMKQFHPRYAVPQELAKVVEEQRAGSAERLHKLLARDMTFNDVARPTLGPWVAVTPPPSTLYVFKRNPFYHRVDPRGWQLPYIGNVRIQISQPGLIPAKTATAESDLQARYIRFDDYTVLKAAEQAGKGIKVHLWDKANGAHIALMPNLNANDETWRKLLRDVRMRRALSLAINREEINKAIFFGLAQESGDTVLPESPLYNERFARRWTSFDLATANRLLDEIGLAKKAYDGIRLLPDGRRAEIIVDTAGESNEQADILSLIRDSWRQAGIVLLPRPTQRDLFRKRVYSGQSIMSVWSGHNNGLPTASTCPEFLAPISQAQLQWPSWGLYTQTMGRKGTPPDLPAAKKLLTLLSEWRTAGSVDEQRRIWHEMLGIYADNLFSIGIVNRTKQPVVISSKLRNVPEQGFFAFEPGGYFGIYNPEAFWLDESGSDKRAGGTPSGGPKRRDG